MASVVRRQVKALMSFASGTVAVGFSTLDWTHNEGGTDDVVQRIYGVDVMYLNKIKKQRH